MLEQVLLTIGASAATTGLIIAALRAGGPLLSKLFGTVLKTRAELDADRDRIIANLRQENTDIQRRLTNAETRASNAEAEVARLNTFIDMLLSRLGMTREAVESGEPLPLSRRVRRTG